MNRFHTTLIASIATILIVPTLPGCTPTDANNNNKTNLIATQLSQQEIYNIAKSITVAVLADPTTAPLGS